MKACLPVILITIYLASVTWAGCSSQSPYEEGLIRYDGEWVRDSLDTYTVNEFEVKRIGHFTDIGYGYQWWSANVGEHHVNFAWGHGGQLIVLEDKLNIVIVTTADPFYGKDIHFDAWKYEEAIIEMVGDFICALSS